VIIPWQVVGEFLRFLRSLQDQKRIQREDLERLFNAYRRLFPLVLPTLSVLGRALSLTSRYSLSHWDSMLLGACVDKLYTEDMGAPIVIDGIALVNPFL
jgi:predicted nucleic acid-binding protein